VNTTAIENNDWFRISGIGEEKYKSVQFTFRGQEINRIRVELDPESSRAIAEILRSITNWAA
jgi:hypothetical protein